MVLSYFGQRHVEVAALNASFQPIRTRMEGRPDPQTPRELVQVRLHVPDSYLIHKKGTAQTATSGGNCSPRQELRLDAGPNPHLPGTQPHQHELRAYLNNLPAKDSLEFVKCVRNAISLAGFGNGFEKLPPQERQDIELQLSRGLIMNIKQALSAHGEFAQAHHNPPSAAPAGLRQASTAPELDCRRLASSTDSPLTLQQLLERSQSPPQRSQNRQKGLMEQLRQHPSLPHAEPIAELSQSDLSQSVSPLRAKHPIRTSVSRSSSRGIPTPAGRVIGQHASEGQLPSMSPLTHQRPEEPAFFGYPRGFNREQGGPVRTCPDLPSFWPSSSMYRYQDSLKGHEGKGTAKGSRRLQDVSMRSGASADSTQVSTMDSLPHYGFVPRVNTMDSLPSDWSQPSQQMDSLPSDWRDSLPSDWSGPSRQVNTMDSLPHLPDVLEEEDELIPTGSSNRRRRSPYAEVQTAQAKDVQPMQRTPVWNNVASIASRDNTRPSGSFAPFRAQSPEAARAGSGAQPNSPPGPPLPVGCVNTGVPAQPPLPFGLLAPKTFERTYSV